MPQMCMQHTECPPFTVSSCASTYLSCILLLRPLEWWRIIVMSTSVYVSVCLSVCASVCQSVCEHIYGATSAIFAKFLVHVPYGRGSVLLRQGDETPRRRGNLGDFSTHWQCIVTRSLQMGSTGKGLMARSAQRQRSVSYNCLATSVIQSTRTNAPHTQFQRSSDT